MAVPKAITFDCYGTLIDWEGEIRQFFQQILQEQGVSAAAGDVARLQRHWEEIQFTYIQGPYRPYKEVLKNTLPMAFRDFGYPCRPEDGVRFAESMGRWRPFPDTRAALRELKKYTKIALITNTDDAIIAETVHQLGVPFDEVITAEQAGAYKPAQQGFRLALERLGVDQAEVLHAGFGFKYDIVPAAQMGWQTCWINRYGEVRPVDVKETYLVGDLATLTLLVKGMAYPPPVE